jgi:guanylate kinase
MAKAKIELSFAKDFDITLPNNELSVACAEAEKIVSDFLNKKD